MFSSSHLQALTLEEFGVRGATCAKNICYLRTVEDATKLVETMSTCKGGNGVVIGGGYIGMEVAAALVSKQISITMVFMDSYLSECCFVHAVNQIPG